MKKKITIFASLAAASVLSAAEYKLDEIGVETTVQSKAVTAESLKTDISDEDTSKTLSGVLKNEPFIQTRGAGAFGSEIYLRGRGLNGVPVYYNGMQINQAHGDSTNIISMADVDSIEVLRGPSGAELGNHGTSGAVIIKDKKPVFLNKDGYQFSAQTSFSQSAGALSSEQSSAKAELTSKDLYFAVYGAQSYAGTYKNGDGTEIRHSDEDRQSGGVKFAVNMKDKGVVTFKAERSMVNASDASSIAATTVGSTYSFTDKPDNTLDYYMLRYENEKLGFVDKISAEAFYSEAMYNIFTEYEKGSPIFINAQNTTKQLFRQSDTGGGKVEALKVLQNHSLKATLSYEHSNIANGLRSYSASGWGQWSNAPGIKGGNEDSTLLSVSDSMAYGANKIDVAASYEYVKRSVISNISIAAPYSVPKQDTDKKDNLLSVSAKYGYELSKLFVPYVKFASNERVPYFNEAYGNTPNGTQIPNQDMKNEKVQNYELGFEGKTRSSSYGSSIYYSKYKNYVELQLTGVMVGTTPQKQYKNLDNAYIYGLEAWAEHNVWQDYNVGGAFSYTYGKNEDVDQPLAYIAPATLTLKISKKPAGKTGLFGEVEEVMAATQSRISSVAGETSTSGYAITNLTAGYKFGNVLFAKDVNVKLDVNNLFNRNYRMHLTTPSNYVRMEEPGMYALASLNMKF